MTQTQKQTQKQDYGSNLDASFSMFLLVGQIICAVLIIVTLIYVAASPLIYDNNYLPLNVLVAVIPFALFIVAAGVTRWKVRRGHVSLPVYLFLLIAAGASLLISFGWFQDPMHDIGMLIGSHGRWGCESFGHGSTHQYLIRDDTMPWILFGPFVLTTLVHYILSGGKPEKPE